MENSLAIKKNNSSINVLKTLLILMQDNYTMAELVENLNQQEKEPIFNNSVISKYINTCRYCGFEIPKIQNKYYLSQVPFGLSLSVREFTLIENLHQIARITCSKRVNKYINKIVKMLAKYANKIVIRVEDVSKDKMYSIIEKAVQEERYVRFLYRSKYSIDAIPLGIKNNNGKNYFTIFHNNEEKQVAFDKISGLEILNKSFGENNQNIEVLYKLTGGLAQRYSLRENEKIVDSVEGQFIVVSNIGERKEILLSRLLRYDSLCEILSPSSYREEMIKIIKETLLNYEE